MIPYRFGPSSQLRPPCPSPHAKHGRLLKARWKRLLWPLLTSHGISSVGSPQVRTRCFPAQPPHLPPRLEPVDCSAALRRRVSSPSSSVRCVVPAHPPCRPSMRFLFISSPVSSSLPPHGRLPFRSWLRVVVFFHVNHVWFSDRGLSPHLQRAHAGRTQSGPRD